MLTLLYSLQTLLNALFAHTNNLKFIKKKMHKQVDDAKKVNVTHEKHSPIDDKQPQSACRDNNRCNRTTIELCVVNQSNLCLYCYFMIVSRPNIT